MFEKKYVNEEIEKLISDYDKLFCKAMREVDAEHVVVYDQVLAAFRQLQLNLGLKPYEELVD